MIVHRHLIAAFLSALLLSSDAWAQGGETARAYFEESLIEINSTDSGIGSPRAVTVKVDGQTVKEFVVDAGFALDILATYEGLDGYYLVLRTNMGQGVCVGTDLYVLKISFAEMTHKSGARAEVSPRLRDCMGEIPEVHFSFDNKGSVVVSVFNNVLRSGRWIKVNKGRKGFGRKTRHGY